MFIWRYDMIIFIYKSWSVNSGWQTLFVRSKVARGDSFDFKMLIAIFSLQEQNFNKYIVNFKKNNEIFNSFFAEKSVLPSQLTFLTENSLANCHFSKKDILQIIRNSDFNKAHYSICQSLEIMFKRYIRFSNVILSSANVNFNGFQIFDA